jgi:hypothetical protein
METGELSCTPIGLFHCVKANGNWWPALQLLATFLHKSEPLEWGLLCLLPVLYWFVAWLILQHWKWTPYSPTKFQLNFKGLQSLTSHKNPSIVSKVFCHVFISGWYFKIPFWTQSEPILSMCFFQFFHTVAWIFCHLYNLKFSYNISIYLYPKRAHLTVLKENISVDIKCLSFALRILDSLSYDVNLASHKFGLP